MSGAYEVIVIGAGHHGLTCACYLAHAGLKVLVLERYETYGGMTVSEEITAPGFLSDVHASGYLVAKLTPAPEELGLERHGLDVIMPNANWAQVFPDDRTFTIGRDIEETSRSMATFSRADAGAWRVLYQRYLTAKPEIVAGMTLTPPSLSNEFAGKDAVDSYRFQFQSARTWVDETFQSPEMRYFFASCRAGPGRCARRQFRLAVRRSCAGRWRQHGQRRHAPRIVRARRRACRPMAARSVSARA